MIAFAGRLFSQGRNFVRFAVTLVILVFICAGCQSATSPAQVTPIPGAPGWSAVQIIAQLTEPSFQPAVTFSNGEPIAGWWSHTTNGGASQLLLARLTDPPIITTLTLGQMPNHLSLFSSTYGLVAIWQDQNAASADQSDRRIYAAVLNPDLTLARSPVQITNGPTDGYAAELLPSGDMVIAWTGYIGTAADSLALSALGAGGTVFPAQIIAANVAHPALMITPGGQLMAGWLSPQPGSTWAIQIAAIQVTTDPAHKITLQSGTINTIGFLQPGGNNNSQVLDSFALSSDAAGCEALWSTVAIRPDSVGALSMLTFPCMADITNSAKSQQTKLMDGGRWPVSVSTLQNGATVAPIGSTLVGTGGDTPVVLWVANGQVIRTDKLTPALPLTTVGSLALAANPANGQLIAVWSQINPDGKFVLNADRQALPFR